MRRTRKQQGKIVWLPVAIAAATAAINTIANDHGKPKK